MLRFKILLLALALSSSVAVGVDVPTNWTPCIQNDCAEAMETCASTKCEGLVACQRCIAEFFPKCLACYKEISKPTPSSRVPFGRRPALRVLKGSCQVNCHTKSFQGESFRETCYCYLDQPVNPIKEELVFEDHEDYVSSVIVLKDGSVASGSFDKNVVVRNFESKTVKTLTGHSGFVLSLAALHDGSVASGSRDNTIKIWDLESGEWVRQLEEHSDRVCALAVLHNGLLASGSWDKTIRIWNATTGQRMRILTDHTNSVCSLTVLDNGYLVSGSNDKTIRVWNPNDQFSAVGAPIQVGGNVVSLATLSGDRFVSGTNDRKAILWSSSTLAQVASKTLDSDMLLISLQTTGKGNVVIGDDGGNVRYWNIKDNSLGPKILVHDYAIYSMALLRNGQLVTVSGDHTTKVLNTPM